jgi:hypothetical protein
MSWSNFFTGAFFASCLWVAGWLLMPPPAPAWGQCPPSNEGEKLVSMAQYEDHTDCFYARNVVGRVLRKKVSL